MSIFGSNIKLGIESFPEASLLSYGLFKDGLWVRSVEPIGVFYRKAGEAFKMDVGLTKEFGDFDFEPDFSTIPKMPYGVYDAILNFHKSIYGKINSEVYCMVFWNVEQQDFEIYVPPQKVSYASVKYEKNSGPFISGSHIPVFECHSHSNMGAFFSGTDLKDEIASRYFAVYGHLGQEKEDFVVRVASNGQAKDLTKEDVFDMALERLSEASDYTVDVEAALEVIETYKPPVAQPRASQSYEWDIEDTYATASVTEAEAIEETYWKPVTTRQPSPHTLISYDVSQLMISRTYKSELAKNLGASIADLLASLEDFDLDQVAEDFLEGFESTLATGDSDDI